MYASVGEVEHTRRPRAAQLPELRIASAAARQQHEKSLCSGPDGSAKGEVSHKGAAAQLCELRKSILPPAPCKLVPKNCAKIFIVCIL